MTGQTVKQGGRWHRQRMAAALVAIVVTLICVLALAAPAGAANFSPASGVPGAIPDGTADSTTCPDPSSLAVTFNVAGLEGTITDVRVANLTFAPAHTLAGDLAVQLSSPGGAVTTGIFARTGATGTSVAGDDSDLLGPYTFADTSPFTPTWWQAAAAAGPALPIASASYRSSTAGPDGGIPDSITPAFSGLTNPNGTWTLRFFDCSAGETGTVSAATLGVTASPPPNDNFANAVGLFGSSVLVTGNNRGATEEGGEPNYMTEDVSSTDPSVTRSVWYRWTAPGSGPASVDTCNTNPMTDPIFDSMLAVFTGSMPGPLTTVASNNNSADCPAGSFRSKVNFTATQGTTYQVLVDGCCGAPAGDFRLNLAGPPGPLLPLTPSGTAAAPKKPSNQFDFGGLKRNEENGTATLKVTVPGAGKLALSGKGLVKQRLAGNGTALERQVFGAGKFNLEVRAKGAKKAKLKETGKVKVKAKVTFTPSGGSAASDSRRITLKKN